MGKIAKPQRSKKNKKIKSIDPFYKGDRKNRRSLTQNQKPSSYEQEVPRKLRMLGFTIDSTKVTGVGKKSKNKFIVQKTPDAPTKYDNKFNTPLGSKSGHSKPSNKDTKGESKGEETPKKSKKERRKERYEEIKKAKREKKGLKPEIPKEVLNDYIDNLKPVRPYLQPKFKQLGSETHAQFMRRVNEETHQTITKSQLDSKFEMSDEKKMRTSMKKAKVGLSNKKKQRLKERKERKAQTVKDKKRERHMDFNALKDDKVAFGDVAHAPPSLTVRPKKAKNVTNNDRPGLRMPELHKAVARNVAESQGLKHQNSDTKEPTSIRPVGKSTKRKNLSNSQKIQLDAQRDLVIEAYRQVKKRKS